MEFHVVCPETNGDFGDELEPAEGLGKSALIEKLHVHLDYYGGDHLLEIRGIYFVTDRLLAEMDRRGLTGFTSREMKTTWEEGATSDAPDGQFPEFRWLVIDGQEGVDDLGLLAVGRWKVEYPKVSERFLDLLDELTPGCKARLIGMGEAVLEEEGDDSSAT